MNKVGKILLPIFLIICIGLIYTLTEKREILNIRGINVEIIGEKNKEVENYLEDINYMDDYLISLCEKIVFTDKHVSLEADLDISQAPENANAVTLPDKRIIYINTNSYNSLTMMHEFFHLLDYEYMISSNKEFINFVDEHIKHWNLGDYQSSNYAEAFVGFMLDYRYKIVDMENDCPEGYEAAKMIVEHASGDALQ